MSQTNTPVPHKTPDDVALGFIKALGLPTDGITELTLRFRPEEFPEVIVTRVLFEDHALAALDRVTEEITKYEIRPVLEKGGAVVTQD